MKLTIKRLTRIAILVALAIVLRSLFGPFPNMKPITAIFFATVISMSLLDGILVMALTMFISSFMFGFGPWVLYQILDYTVLLVLWYLIAPKLSLRWQSALVCLLSFMYGVIYDYSYGLIFNSGLTFVVSGLQYDLYHAVSTLIFYPIIVTTFRRFLK